MENTAKDTIEHWFPGSDYDGQACDPKDLWGPEFEPDAVLERYCQGEIEAWLIELARDPDTDAPKTIRAKIVFCGEVFTASAKIERNAEIQITEGE